MLGAYRRSAAFGIALLLSALPAAAAGSLAERLSVLDAALAARPEDTALWLERATLLREDGQAERALEDVARAEKSGAEPGSLERERGLVLLELWRPEAAAVALARALELRPQDAFARAMRARALEATGREREAAAEYARALADAPQAAAAPEWFVGRARALAAVTPPDLDAAIRALDDASAALGPAPAFDLTALELEVRAGHTDAALARLDRIAASSPRPEGLLVQRGELLEYARRAQEAGAAYGAALAAMEGLPPQQRATPAASKLATRARDGIARLSEAAAR